MNEPAYAELVREFGHARVVEVLREQVEAERQGNEADGDERVERVGASLRAAVAPRLRRVINASGVILHTNLGRAPLSRAAVDALAVAAGYSNLELDLETGRRGERAALVSGLLTQLFGAEAAFVVNNNAAAILLALTALCKGKEVIVSRGQQVEIGGSFRMPDVMRLSGARMVEVGTTNRTRKDDYEQAITSRTAALLRVHPSNFRVEGFTETASPAEMAAVAHAHELLLIDDLGSGAAEPIAGEPTVAESLPGFYAAMKPLLRTAAEGIDTLVWLATDPGAGSVSGKVFLDRRARPFDRVPATRVPAADRRRLWEIVVGLSGSPDPLPES